MNNGLVVKALDCQSRGLRVQNHWVAPRSTQPFILPRSIKWVPGISRNLVVKSKLPHRSGSSLEAVEPHPWKGTIKFFSLKKTFQKHGSEQAGVISHFAVHLRNSSVKLAWFSGNRFNILFWNAACVLFYQRNFISFFNIYGNPNKLVSAVQEDLDEIKNIASCRALGIIDKLNKQLIDSWKHPWFESSNWRNSKKLPMMVGRLITFTFWSKTWFWRSWRPQGWSL